MVLDEGASSGASSVRGGAASEPAETDDFAGARQRDAGEEAGHDASLVAGLVRGDPAALEELYDRHAAALYRVAYRRLGDRQLAEEVLQDTYLALWDHAEQFDPAAGPLLTWLAAIARNRATDRLRAIRRRPALSMSDIGGPGEDAHRVVERLVRSGELIGSSPPAMLPEDEIDNAETRERIRAAVVSLPEVERAVLRLGYYEELSQSEIATRLGWPLGTVKTRTRRALMHLRTALIDIVGPSVVAPSAGPSDVRVGEGVTDGAR